MTAREKALAKLEVWQAALAMPLERNAPIGLMRAEILRRIRKARRLLRAGEGTMEGASRNALADVYTALRIAIPQKARRFHEEVDELIKLTLCD